MANTYTLISNTTVGSGGAATISFTSIPATYTDLLVSLSGRIDQTGIVRQVDISFNGSTANFTGMYLQGNGSTGASGSLGQYVGNATGTSATASTFGNTSIYIPNYASSNNKSFSVDFATENNAATADLGLIAGLWSNSAAITSITLTPNTVGNFVQYSTAYLYGISNA
jgi:hypothetical protein